MKLSCFLTTYGFTLFIVDPIVMRKTTFRGIMILVVYVDDILLTCSDEEVIFVIKIYLHQHFVTQDLYTPRYFLGIEFAYQSSKLILSQRKYAIDLLQEIGLLGCKPTTSPIKAWLKFLDISSLVLKDVNCYHRLLRKLIYLMVAYPNIIYTINVLSQLT